MSVSEEDRKAYERGKKDLKRSIPEILTDHIFHPPPADNEAYKKAQRGEPFDEDKKEDED